MAKKVLLCVSGTQATSALWSNRKLLRCQVFNNDETGRLAFDAFLQNLPGVPVHIMVDAVEEDYRFETLPHVFGRDRQLVLQRRLKQLYRNTSYYAANKEGRDPSKRRDDQYLFAALTNPEILYDWLHIIDTRGSPLAGVFLLPVVSGTLLENLRLKHPNILLVSQNSAGLRQSFFRHQRLRISRLTPLETTFGRSRIATYAEEIANTRLYLDPLRLMPRDETLSIVIADRDGSLAELYRTLSVQTGTGQTTYLSKNDLISKLGLDHSALQSSPDALFLYVLGLQKQLLNLASAELTQKYTLRQLSHGIYYASAAVLLGLLGWSGANLYFQQSNIDHAKNIAMEASAEHQEYLKVTGHFPPTPTSAENLRKAVETAKIIRANLRTPEQMLNVVSIALSASPEIYLKRLDWAYNLRNTLPPEFNKIALHSVANNERRQICLIVGEVRPFRGDYRVAIENINSFVQKLAADKSVESVSVLDLPLNTSTANALSGNTAQQDTTAATANFTISVVLKRGT